MIVEVLNVSFQYDSVQALNDVTLRLEPGRVTCVVGPNGAGKSTFLKVLASILRPSKGVVYLDGKDLRSYNARELAKVIALEEPYISRNMPMTVLDFLLTARYPHQGVLRYFEGLEDVEVVERVAEDLNIAHLLSRRLDQVSSGELQKIVVAHALIKKPKILLLDEPSAFLDIRHRFEVLDYVKRTTIAEGITTVIALHDLHLASMYCDAVVVMDRGSVIACGDPVKVFTSNVIEEVYGVDVEIIMSDNSVFVIPKPKHFIR